MRNNNMELESILKSYARYAPLYDHTFGSLVGKPGLTRAVEIVNRQPGNVLEIGVGTGLALPLYSRDQRVTGIDVSPQMLRRARRRANRLALTQVESLLIGDAAELAFADAAFDAVVAAYVMSVVPDPEAVIGEIERVCRPGGTVVIVNHFAADRGIRSVVERGLAPLSNMLGWRPDFPLQEILARTTLRVVDTRTLPPFGLFTLLQLEKQAS